jgi:hypothetical protein
MDESGQGSGELILLFGGIIIIALLMLYTYNSYLSSFNGAYTNGNDFGALKDKFN